MLTKKQALIIGCGDLGLRCARRLADDGWSVTGARRDTSTLPDWIDPLLLDVTYPETLASIAESNWDLVIITLTTRGEEGYQRVYVEGVNNILSVLSGEPLVLFASSTSVYSQSDGSEVDENSPAMPAGFAGKSILEAESLLVKSTFNTCSIRLTGLYGGGRSNHLLKALRSGQICPAEPSKYSNRIHIDDAARLMVHLANQYFTGKKLESVYLAADGNPAPLREIMEWLASENDIDIDSLEETYIARRGGNRRCSNQRVLNSGYEFLYPHYTRGYEA